MKKLAVFLAASMLFVQAAEAAYKINPYTGKQDYYESAGDVVSDTTPQLGGDLDAQGNDITGVGAFTATTVTANNGTVSATAFNYVNTTSTVPTGTVGHTGFDTNAHATGRGAIQVNDGTSLTYLLGLLASDTPSNGQVPKWNTGGTITWEADADTGGAPALNAIGDAAASDSIDLAGFTVTITGSGLFAVSSDMTMTGTVTMPQGTAPLVNAAGEMAIDTTADQLVFYGGAKRVLSRFQTECSTVEDPVDADDNIPLFIFTEASTITDVSCNTTGSSTPNIAIVLGDGTNSFESITCDDDGATDDGTITNASFNAEEPIEVDFGAPSGTVDFCTICVTRTVDAA